MWPLGLYGAVTQDQKIPTQTLQGFEFVEDLLGGLGQSAVDGPRFNVGGTYQEDRNVLARHLAQLFAHSNSTL